MSGSAETSPQELMCRISAELEAMRRAILARDTCAIECHTQKTSALLAQLQRFLVGEQILPSPDLFQLRTVTQRCSVVVAHVRRSVCAMLGLYRSVTDESSQPFGAGL